MSARAKQIGGEQDVERDPIEAINEETERDILAEFGREEGEVNWKIDVHRVPLNQDGTARKAAEDYCFSTDQSGYDQIKQRLYDHYGAGRYRIRVRKNGRLFASEDFSLVTPFGWKPKAVEAEKPPQDNQTVANVLASAMERQTQMMMDAMREIRQVPAVQSSSQTETMALVAQILTLAKALQPPPPPPPNIDAYLGMFSKGMELAASAGPGGETGFMDIAKTAMQSLPAFFASLQQNPPPQRPAMPQPEQRIPLVQSPPQPQQRPQSPPQPRPAAQQPPPENPAASQQAMQNQMLQLLGYLTERARTNADTELYAEWLLDNVPSDILEPLLKNEVTLDQLLYLYAPAQQYRQWFETVLGFARSYAFEAGPGDDGHANGGFDDAPGRGNGSAGNAQTNVGTDPQGETLPENSQAGD